MPVFVRSGGQTVEVAPRIRSGGALTGDTDQLWARQGGTNKLIYPDPAAVAAGNLLAVTGLMVTAGPDHDSVTVGWTNPTQPDVTPTELQVRLPAISAVWDVIDVAAVSQSWSALDASTEYIAQVRYVRRADGVVTHTSPVRSVGFTTTAAPIGAPAPDPGGSGTDTVWPIGGSVGGTPTAPSTADGCWWEWKLQIIRLTDLVWIDTGITDEFDGDASFTDSYDASALDNTRTYRPAIREACDTTGDGSADTFGEWQYGPAFSGGFDWDATCGNLPGSALLNLVVLDDAVWAFPKSCSFEGFPGSRMIDAVSNTHIQPGSNFAAAYVHESGDWGVVADSDGGTTMLAGLAAVEATVGVPDQDMTIHAQYRFAPSHTSDAGAFRAIARYGSFAVEFRVTETASGFVPSVRLLMASGVVTLTGSEIALDSNIHGFTLRWDADGNKELWVDGTLEDSDTSGDDWLDGLTPTPYAVTAAGSFGSNMQQAGWDRALTDEEIESLTLLELESFGAATGGDTTFALDTEEDSLVILATHHREIGATTALSPASVATNLDNVTTLYASSRYDTMDVSDGAAAYFSAEAVTAGPVNCSPPPGHAAVGASFAVGASIVQTAKAQVEGGTGTVSIALPSSPGGRVLVFLVGGGVQSLVGVGTAPAGWTMVVAEESPGSGGYYKRGWLFEGTAQSFAWTAPGINSNGGWSAMIVEIA